MSTHNKSWLDEQDEQEFARLERVRRKHECTLAQYPNCSDPMHPGCEYCWEGPDEPDDNPTVFSEIDDNE